MSAEDQRRTPQAGTEQHGREAHDALKDALKAVAGDATRPATAKAAVAPAAASNAMAGDPDRTTLVKRNAAAGLGEAIAAAKSVPGPSPAPVDAVPPTVGLRGPKGATAPEPAKTQMVRGKQKPGRSDFHQDPVVGWLVVIGGPGLGSFRPVFEGNNTIGRSSSQRVAIDFGDDAISAEEQAYLRYDSTDRQFLFVPNLAKTNVVRVNDDKPTGAVRLSAMDVITMGRTQLVFVPFCGDEFDWTDLADLKE